MAALVLASRLSEDHVALAFVMAFKIHIHAIDAKISVSKDFCKDDAHALQTAFK